jgi:hypothetical protein
VVIEVREVELPGEAPAALERGICTLRKPSPKVKTAGAGKMVVPSRGVHGVLVDLKDDAEGWVPLEVEYPPVSADVRTDYQVIKRYPKLASLRSRARARTGVDTLSPRGVHRTRGPHPSRYVPLLRAYRIGIDGGGIDIRVAEPLLEHVQRDIALHGRDAEGMT